MTSKRYAYGTDGQRITTSDGTSRLSYLSHAPLALRLVGLIPLLSAAAYFFLIAWSAVYSEITGARPPGADRTERFFARLNGPVLTRRRR